MQKANDIQLHLREIANNFSQASHLFMNLANQFGEAAPKEEAKAPVQEKKAPKKKAEKPAPVEEEKEEWEDVEEEETEEEKPVTREEVGALCRELAKKADTEVVKGIVKKMGVNKAALVPEKELGRFKALLVEAMENLDV